MQLPPSHIHVSERETGHYWPDGRWDNNRWEDCAWDSAVEFVRAIGRKSTPATHTEAEALRRASGEDTWSGSNPDDVRRGILRRYGMATNPVVRGWTNLKPRLTVGKVASVSGSMRVFPDGHRLRRHDPNFDDSHCVVVFKLDGLARYWWCDPLAPKGEYRGEWVSESELARYVNGLPFNGHLVGTLPVVKPSTALQRAIASLRVYISRLARVKNPTAAQVAKLKLYRARLAEYLKR